MMRPQNPAAGPPGQHRSGFNPPNGRKPWEGGQPRFPGAAHDHHRSDVAGQSNEENDSLSKPRPLMEGLFRDFPAGPGGDPWKPSQQPNAPGDSARRPKPGNHFDTGFEAVPFDQRPGVRPRFPGPPAFRQERPESHSNMGNRPPFGEPWRDGPPDQRHPRPPLGNVQPVRPPFGETPADVRGPPDAHHPSGVQRSPKDMKRPWEGEPESAKRRPPQPHESPRSWRFQAGDPEHDRLREDRHRPQEDRGLPSGGPDEKIHFQVPRLARGLAGRLAQEASGQSPQRRRSRFDAPPPELAEPWRPMEQQPLDSGHPEDKSQVANQDPEPAARLEEQDISQDGQEKDASKEEGILKDAAPEEDIMLVNDGKVPLLGEWPVEQGEPAPDQEKLGQGKDDNNERNHGQFGTPDSKDTQVPFVDKKPPKKSRFAPLDERQDKPSEEQASEPANKPGDKPQHGAQVPFLVNCPPASKDAPAPAHGHPAFGERPASQSDQLPTEDGRPVPAEGDQFGQERPPSGDRPFSHFDAGGLPVPDGERDRPPFGDQVAGPPFPDRKEGPPFGDHKGAPPFGEHGGGPPFGDRSESGPPFADHREAGPPFGEREGGPQFGDRKGGAPFRNRKGGPPFGNRKSGSRFGEGGPLGDRDGGPPFGNRREAGPPFGDLPFEQEPPRRGQGVFDTGLDRDNVNPEQPGDFERPPHIGDAASPRAPMFRPGGPPFEQAPYSSEQRPFEQAHPPPPFGGNAPPFVGDAGPHGPEGRPPFEEGAPFADGRPMFPGGRSPFREGGPPHFEEGRPPHFEEGRPPHFEEGRPPFPVDRPPFEEGAPPFQDNRPPFEEHQPSFHDQRPLDQPPFDEHRAPFDDQRPLYDNQQPPFEDSRPPFERHGPPFGEERPFDEGHPPRRFDDGFPEHFDEGRPHRFEDRERRFDNRRQGRFDTPPFGGGRSSPGRHRHFDSGRDLPPRDYFDHQGDSGRDERRGGWFDRGDAPPPHHRDDGRHGRQHDERDYRPRPFGWASGDGGPR